MKVLKTGFMNHLLLDLRVIFGPNKWQGHMLILIGVIDLTVSTFGSSEQLLFDKQDCQNVFLGAFLFFTYFECILNYCGTP